MSDIPVRTFRTYPDQMFKISSKHKAWPCASGRLLRVITGVCHLCSGYPTPLMHHSRILLIPRSAPSSMFKQAARVVSAVLLTRFCKAAHSRMPRCFTVMLQLRCPVELLMHCRSMFALDMQVWCDVHLQAPKTEKHVGFADEGLLPGSCPTGSK